MNFWCWNIDIKCWKTEHLMLEDCIINMLEAFISQYVGSLYQTMCWKTVYLHSVGGLNYLICWKTVCISSVGGLYQ